MKRIVSTIAIVCFGVAATTAILNAAPASSGTAAPGSIAVGSLVVKVLDKHDNPVDSAKVRVWFANTEKVAARGLTDRGGIVFFEQMKAGEYMVFVSKEKMGEGKQPVLITANQQTVVSVVLD